VFIGKDPIVHGTLEISGWRELLETHDFWVNDPAYQTKFDLLHQGVIFYGLVANNQIGLIPEYAKKSPAFDFYPTPPELFNDLRTTPLLSEIATVHQHLFGDGEISKIGLYAFAPGGLVGYHVDGVVRLQGDTLDLSSEHEWTAALHIQSTHRTILPIKLGASSKFKLLGDTVDLREGELLEFSNTLPHAFFNSETEHTVLLVTTYKPQH
jgi:hypothetical protein